MSRAPVFLSFALAFALLTPASSEPCEPSTSPAIFVAGVYVTEDCFLDPMWRGEARFGCYGDGPMVIPWVYMETNGVPGLQRGDEVHDDTCGGMVEADTIMF